MSIKLSPRPAKYPHKDGKDGGFREAWWYENKGSIDILIEFEDSRGDVKIARCRIERKYLEDYIKRTKPLRVRTPTKK